MTPTSRRGHSVVCHNGGMHLFGGHVDLKGSCNELWTLDFGEHFQKSCRSLLIQYAPEKSPDKGYWGSFKNTTEAKTTGELQQYKALSSCLGMNAIISWRCTVVKINKTENSGLRMRILFFRSCYHRLCLPSLRKRPIVSKIHCMSSTTTIPCFSKELICFQTMYTSMALIHLGFTEQHSFENAISKKKLC